MEPSILNIKKLYSEGLSAKQVGNKIGLTCWQVIRLMKKYRIPRRDKNGTKKLQYLKQPLTYKIKTNLSLNDEKLKIAGVMLYWGEGNKQEDTLDFANSNPEMVQLYLRFLRKICGIDEKKLRLLIYCYSNQNIKALENYWRNLTGIAKEQFQKPYIRKDFLESKMGKMEYGLAHIRNSDKKLVSQIKDWIKSYSINL